MVEYLLAVDEVELAQLRQVPEQVPRADRRRSGALRGSPGPRPPRSGRSPTISLPPVRSAEAAPSPARSRSRRRGCAACPRDRQRVLPLAKPFLVRIQRKISERSSSVCANARSGLRFHFSLNVLAVAARSPTWRLTLEDWACAGYPPRCLETHAHPPRALEHRGQSVRPLRAEREPGFRSDVLVLEQHPFGYEADIDLRLGTGPSRLRRSSAYLGRCARRPRTTSSTTTSVRPSISDSTGGAGFTPNCPGSSEWGSGPGDLPG